MMSKEEISISISALFQVTLTKGVMVEMQKVKRYSSA